MARLKQLTIFEGPDGGGKTTAAKLHNPGKGRQYYHMGPFSNIEHGLSKEYADVMLPAIFGHSDVIMDRSWISEVPYGLVYRNGKDRIGNEARQLLEWFAHHCVTLVVLCLPPLEVVMENFSKKSQYLDSVEQLKLVYDWYDTKFHTSLDVIRWDYRTGPLSWIR